MAYFKKVDNLTGKPKKEKRESFNSFPKPDSSDDTKPKKKKPFGKGGPNFFEKKKRKTLGEDELPGSRGFYKSKTGYNNPSAPWNKERSTKKEEEKRSYGEDTSRAPLQRGVGGGFSESARPKTFTKKGVLSDPTQEVAHENNPENYGPAKLQFRRINKRAQRSFSKNKERAYEEKKMQMNAEKLKIASKPAITLQDEKKKFMHGKGRPVKKGESRGELVERGEKPKAKKVPNPKPFKPAMPSNWRKVGE